MNEIHDGFQEALGESLERRRRRRRMAALILGGLALGGWLLSRFTAVFESPEPRLERQTAQLPPVESCLDVLCKIPWPRPEPDGNGGFEQWVEDHRVVYTLDAELQQQALAVLERYDVYYGALVAVEPATGRILALAEHSKQEPELTDFCRRATYPAASIVKIITAAAALETGDVTPDTPVRFEGSPYRLYPRKIDPTNRRREGNVHTLAEALGKSNNVVFGKVGVNVVGPELLQRALEQFGFNGSIPFDFRLQESSAAVPAERYPLARTAAGFGEVYLSPVHAALLAAAVGNGGLMMRPFVVDSIEDERGQVLYRAVPAPFRQCTPPEVAEQLAGMMANTVSRGTSAKIFYKYARNLRRKVGVAGKTGSLTGSDPPGKYEWFVGFAPIQEPQIAVASLIVNNGDLWHIKGTYMAQAVMREFFGM
jgi:cell division protein FtsI/penicillin-binding protein 2